MKELRQAPSTDFQFIMAVALFGQLLKSSPYIKDMNYHNVVDLANRGLGDDPNGYRKEFVRLAKAVEQLEK